MNNQERQELKDRLIELGFWGADEPGDPVTDESAALKVGERATERFGVLLVSSAGVAGGVSISPGQDVLIICEESTRQIASGETYAEAICLASIALPEFLKQHPECAAKPDESAAS